MDNWLTYGEYARERYEERLKEAEAYRRIRSLPRQNQAHLLIRLVSAVSHRLVHRRVAANDATA